MMRHIKIGDIVRIEIPDEANGDPFHVLVLTEPICDGIDSLCDVMLLETGEIETSFPILERDTVIA
jgi:hypothetical protein